LLLVVVLRTGFGERLRLILRSGNGSGSRCCNTAQLLRCMNVALKLFLALFQLGVTIGC
jgi:hypothetical protein